MNVNTEVKIMQFVIDELSEFFNRNDTQIQKELHNVADIKRNKLTFQHSYSSLLIYKIEEVKKLSFIELKSKILTYLEILKEKISSVILKIKKEKEKSVNRLFNVILKWSEETIHTRVIPILPYIALGIVILIIIVTRTLIKSIIIYLLVCLTLTFILYANNRLTLIALVPWASILITFMIVARINIIKASSTIIERIKERKSIFMVALGLTVVTLLFPLQKVQNKLVPSLIKKLNLR